MKNIVRAHSKATRTPRRTQAKTRQRLTHGKRALQAADAFSNAFYELDRVQHETQNILKLSATLLQQTSGPAGAQLAADYSKVLAATARNLAVAVTGVYEAVNQFSPLIDERCPA